MKTKLLAALAVLMLCGCSTAPISGPDKMSETTRFKHHRALPFCAPAATGDPLYDYVDFEADVNDPDGQAGLVQAMRFWWNMEFIQFLPTGAVIMDEDARAFSKDYSLPFTENSDIFEFTAAGSIVGYSEFSASTDPEVAIKAPNARVCFEEEVVGITSQQYAVGGTSPLYERGAWAFRLALVSGQWRLYYYFYFQLLDSVGDPVASISNPANPSGLTEVTTGTCDLDGLSLNWVGETDWSVTTGLDLDSSCSFFTYPAP